ncbi:DNA primase [Paenalcaligenes niemegkensis]|uniref:DNA primase n=1 Tax=Paenalcaligenes niemegkensis TaxID=2895469 RepID=UPI001EE7EA0F|nr:DNA primase [Paenalcaligenes niemegkensis]MCQ9616718.1 DNA primase [Paenalcaligenes niemegkensis]
MIPESFIQELLVRVDISDVVGRYVQLRKGGANLLGLCPFHNEKSPSFTVSPTKQFYHCFGCGAHGSAVSFLMQHTGATFPEAVRSLASEVGLTVPEAPRSPHQRAADQRRKAEVSQHQQILDAAQAHYLRELKRSDDAKNYLKQRGLTGQIAKQFGLGWSGTERRGLSSVYPNYEDPLLVESGLVIESDDARRYDRFRRRIMFPIRNTRGHVIGFGGRLIEKGEPKYLNSPETPLFSKGHELYGLWEGRQGIRHEGFVVVVEGYMDVVALAQSGLQNAVATLGTATTEFHIKKLVRASDRIVFSFDGDRAGRQAAWRALGTCLPLVRDDVAMRFLFLPEGHDPDSYVREFGADAFREAAGQASALSTFMLDELATRHRMDEAEGRAACVHEALPLLKTLADTTLALQIQHEFAKLVQLTPDELQQRLDGLTSPRTFTEQAPSNEAPPRSFDDIPPDFSMGYDPAETYFDGPPSDYGAASSEPSAEPWTKKKRGKYKKRGEFEQGPGLGRQKRSVTPIAKRLLRLLAAYPHLVDGLADQQLEIIVQSPNLILVQELIALINVSEARHSGALLEAADPENEVGALLISLTTEILDDEELPDPQAEWNDALRHIELELIKSEQSELIAAGLPDEASRRRYQELTRRMALLNAAPLTQLK